jgi:hypothetical protein
MPDSHSDFGVMLTEFGKAGLDTSEKFFINPNQRRIVFGNISFIFDSDGNFIRFERKFDMQGNTRVLICQLSE